MAILIDHKLGHTFRAGEDLAGPGILCHPHFGSFDDDVVYLVADRNQNGDFGVY